MSERKLRYSERRRLAESGSLGDYVHDDVPVTFRNAIHYLIYTPSDAPSERARTGLIRQVHQEARPFFGWHGQETVPTFLVRASVDELLDFLELLIEICTTRSFESAYIGNHRYDWVKVMPQVEDQINALCERHRFGYSFEAGDARKIGSPALEVEVVGPALLAVSRPGWEQVEKSFREALDHQRGGETDDAVTAAHAAVEAALKAVGMTGQFSTMTKQFRNSAIVPPYLRQAPEALDSLLTLLDRSNAMRSVEGDAHGKAPGADDVPQELADLAIHWAGAFVVYLAETSS
jgi:hypothetical protein